MTNTKDETRELEICALYSGGETMEEIGQRYGVSRERIRQILLRNGLGGEGHRGKIDPLRVLGLVDQSTSLDDLVARSGATAGGVGRLLKEMGEWDRAMTLWGYRPQRYTDQQLLDAFRALAAKLGHLPKQPEITADPDCPSSEVFRQRFGSLADTARLAGFPARRHRRNKLTIAQRVEIARRYEFIPSPRGRRFATSNARELAREFDVVAGYIPTLARLHRVPVPA